MKEDNNMEIFMLSQFIDVLNVLEKHESIEDVKIDLETRKKLFREYIDRINISKNFCGLDLFNDKIDQKVGLNKYIYEKSEVYKETNKEIKDTIKQLSSKLDGDDMEKIKKLETLITELKDFDVHLAYKLGAIDGMKIKATCIKI